MSPAAQSGFKRFLKGCGTFLGLAALGFVVIVGIAGYFVYQALKAHEANPGFVPLASAQCAYDSAAGDSALAVALPEELDLGYPNQTYDRLYVRTYVKDGLYDYLDTLLTVYADSVRRDYRLEYRMFDLYNAFAVGDTTFKPFLDAWVESRPQSANARLVRATWLTEMAQDARGARLAAETADGQMSAMHAYLAMAKADVEAAHALDSCSLVGYHLLMLAAPLSGNTALSRKLMEQGLTIQPYSFLLRARHMYNLRPRWGGSYRAMDALAESADSLIPKNPRLRALHGFGAWDRADESERSKDTLRAIAQYDSALAFGDFWQFHLDRGQFMARLDFNEAALTDLERALAQRPQHAQVLYQLARLNYELGRLARGGERATRYHEAFRYIDLSLAIDPSDADVRDSREFYQKQIPQFAPPPPG